mgnify:CR=1 FL=1
MTTLRLLFDASSIIYALKLKCVEILHGNYIQHLTIYEVLNAIWKETYLTKSLSRGEAERFIRIFAEALDYLNILLIHPYELEVFKTAVGLGLTVYDASYVVLTEKNDLTLVTEDEKLRKKASKKVKVVSLRKIVT